MDVASHAMAMPVYQYTVLAADGTETEKLVLWVPGKSSGNERLIWAPEDGGSVHSLQHPGSRHDPALPYSVTREFTGLGPTRHYGAVDCRRMTANMLKKAAQDYDKSRRRLAEAGGSPPARGARLRAPDLTALCGPCPALAIWAGRVHAAPSWKAAAAPSANPRELAAWARYTINALLPSAYYKGYWRTVTVRHGTRLALPRCYLKEWGRGAPVG